MTAPQEKPQKPLRRKKPVQDAKLAKLIGDAYWKANGSTFYPNRKIVEQVVEQINLRYDVSERTALGVPEATDEGLLQPEGHITDVALAGLDSADLLLLFNSLHSDRRMLEDNLRATKVELTTIQDSLNRIKERMRLLNPANKPSDISDHAILRYLQRVKGLDLAATRDELDSAALRECVKHNPDGIFSIGDVTYVVRQGTVVTVIFDEDESER